MIDPSDWSEEELEIFELYNYKCVNCGKPAVVIHELVPKSQRPKTWMEKDNRLTLCHLCHSWAHRISAKKSRPILQEKAERMRKI